MPVLTREPLHIEEAATQAVGIRGIYRLLQPQTDGTQKSYVGMADEMSVRWLTHLRELRAGVHGCWRLQKLWSFCAINADPEKFFYAEVLEECGPLMSEQAMRCRETYFRGVYGEGLLNTQGNNRATGMGRPKVKIRSPKFKVPAIYLAPAVYNAASFQADIDGQTIKRWVETLIMSNVPGTPEEMIAEN